MSESISPQPTPAAIWKYPLPLQDVVELMLPRGARVLTMQKQNGQLTMWALVDPLAPLYLRSFAIVGTGNPAPNPEQGTYLATAQSGPFVWHLFEEIARG